MFKIKNDPSKITKIMLLLSIFLLCLWMLMGTFTTVSWFTDKTRTKVNSFVIGDVSVEVNHKVDKENGNFEYEKVDSFTKLFDDEALYEPGYTQVVYLQIKNVGDVDFDYRLAVNQSDAVLGFNQEGKAIYLPDYLKYGVVFGKTESVINRTIARASAENNMSLADLAFNSFAGQRYSLKPGDIEYAAIIVYMPETVGNTANYRGDARPSVTLGITVLASQAGTIDRL